MKNAFCLFLCILTPGIAAGQTSLVEKAVRTTGEPAPTFAASSILNASVLRSTHYRISESVPVRDYRFQFQIETNYGTFHADGRYMLEKRLRELQAIERAAQLSGGRVIVDSAWDVARKTPKGAVTLLTDPLGALGRAPRGFERMATSLVNRMDRRAGTPTRRNLAIQLGADPETSNPVLSHALTEIAVQQAIGQGASKIALGAALPGLSLLATTEDFREQVAQRSPHEIASDIDAELNQMKVWQPVREQFAYGNRFTSIEKLIYMSYFRELQQIEHLDLMIHMANRADSEAAVLTRIAYVRLLHELHHQSPVASIADAGIPVAIMRDGRIFGICSVDYLHSTQEVQLAAANFRASHPTQSLQFISTGYISPQTQRTLNAAQIQFMRADYGQPQQELRQLTSATQPLATQPSGVSNR